MAQIFKVPVVVALNVFKTYTHAENVLVCELDKQAGAFDMLSSYHWLARGKGSVDLAEAVREAVNKRSYFQFPYNVQLPIVEKIRVVITQTVYRAKDIELIPEAQSKIDCNTQQGFGNLLICMTKTHLFSSLPFPFLPFPSLPFLSLPFPSLPPSPDKTGVRRDLILPISDVRGHHGGSVHLSFGGKG
jgi:monofunctional C1-tetrahydrofolate synthase